MTWLTQSPPPALPAPAKQMPLPHSSSLVQPEPSTNLGAHLPAGEHNSPFLQGKIALHDSSAALLMSQWLVAPQ